MTSPEGSENKSAEIEQENREWLESLDYVHRSQGPERVRQLLRRLQFQADRYGVGGECSLTTPYVNTIPVERQPPYPGNREIERRIKSIIRWNAMAMVVRANRNAQRHRRPHFHLRLLPPPCFEVGFNHFFRARTDGSPGRPRLLPGSCLAGHLRPGLSGGPLQRTATWRISAASSNPRAGCSSYPHPYLMPDFWQFPTVSMGLSPIMAIYQARFNRYLEDRGLKRDRRTRRSGLFWATARWTNRNRWAPSPWPPARSSTT